MLLSMGATLAQDNTLIVVDNIDDIITLDPARAYDAIIMDVQMPDIDGLQATRRIRAAGRAWLPIMAMTANASNADRDACLAAGMDSHIAKWLRTPRGTPTPV